MSMRLRVFGCLGMMVLTLAGCTGNVAYRLSDDELPEVSEIKTFKPGDGGNVASADGRSLKYVTTGTMAAIALKPAKMLAAMPEEMRERVLEQNFGGLQPAQIQELTILISPGGESVLIVNASEPLNVDELAETMFSGEAPAREEKDGRTILRSGNQMGPAVAVKGKEAVITPAQFLDQVLEANNLQSAFAEAYQKMPSDHDIVGLMSMQPVQGMLAGPAGRPGPAAGMGEALKQLDTLHLTMNIGDNEPIQLLAHFDSEDSAKESVESLNSMIGLGKTLLAQMRGQMLRQIPEQDREQVGNLIMGLVNDIKLELDGQDIKTTLRLPEGSVETLYRLAADSRMTMENEQRMNDLRQIGRAIHNYHASHNVLPVASTNAEHLDKDGKPHLSWRVHILPYIGQAKLFEKFRLNESWDSEHNKKLLKEIPSIYQTIPDSTKTTYLRFVSKEGNITAGDPKTKFSSITDGMMNTVLMVDAAPENAVEWTKPQDIAFDPAGDLPALGHPDQDTVGILFCDATPRLISKDRLKLDVLKKLIQRRDGEDVSWEELEE